MLYSSLIASGTILFSIIFGALCMTMDNNKTIVIFHLITGWIMLSIFLIGLAIYPIIHNTPTTL